MELMDFSNGFDTLLNSYAREANFGEAAFNGTVVLDEYEKSQFLTKAQEDIVIELYTGRNNYRESFETTEEMRRVLSILVKEKYLTPVTDCENLAGVAENSRFFTLPEDLWFIIYESVLTCGSKCGNEYNMEVVPIRHDEYNVVRKNPFRGTNSRRALRLDFPGGGVEIICKYNINTYYVRYLRRPKPIVLIDLEGDDMSIHGVSEATNCELHESLHQRILERAVVLALQSRGYANNKENK